MRTEVTKYHCKCGSLNYFSKHTFTNIVFDEIKDTYFFCFDDATKVRIKYCPVCGGKDLSEIYNDLLKPKGCDCKEFNQFVSENPDNVKKNIDSGNVVYWIELKNQGVIFIDYCFFCGKQLSISTNPDFIRPSVEELDKIRKRLLTINHFSEFIEFFGKPNYLVSKKSVVGEDLTFWKDMINYGEYFSEFKTINLTVAEFSDNSIAWRLSLKPAAANPVQ